MDAADQEVELDPNDAWLMRAAGGDDEQEENIGARNPRDRDDEDFSFEDSERFEEDSLCSWISDAESLNQNWRGWNANRSSSHNDIGFSNIPTSSGVTGHRYTGNMLSTSGGDSVGRVGIANGISLDDEDMLCTSACLASANKSKMKRGKFNAPQSLAEMAAHKAARCLSFDDLEQTYHAVSTERRRLAINHANGSPEDKLLILESSFSDHGAIPDKFFLSVVRWCFPESEEDIRLYSCLANGNADEFGRGEFLYQSDSVRDVFQIGYHLSAVVHGSILSGPQLARAEAAAAAAQSVALPSNGPRQQKTSYNVSIRVDRCRIVSCSCSCACKAQWCQHVVAVCLYRINHSQNVEYRVTIWDSINELSNVKLKKLAQFLINDLPRQYLPVAQRLIDQLKEPLSEINAAVGAPDPTDGGHDDVAIWCLDQRVLHDNIHRIISKFCIPSPTVHCDVQYLSSNQPPVASEWQSLLRPHRSKDPEGLWNLLSIVREMFKRRDENATTLLHIITEECFACCQVLMWWYQTSLTHSGRWVPCSSSGNKSNALLSSQNAPQFNCSSLCEEIVQLWRLAALNPRLSNFEREQLAALLQIYHRTAVERIWRNIYSATSESNSQSVNGIITSIMDRRNNPLCAENMRFTVDLFPGFYPALTACHIRCDLSDSSHSSLKEQTNSVNNDCKKELDISISASNSSPNLPVLRRHPRILESTVLPEIPSTSSGYRYTIFYPDDYVKNASRNRSSTNPRKKVLRLKPHLHRHRVRNVEYHEDHISLHGSRGTARSVRRNTLGEEIAEDSAESGHESEGDQSPSTAVPLSVPESSDYDVSSSVKNSYELSGPAADVDEVFAIAHVSPSNWDSKFARCEALMAHGYTKEACEMAVGLAEEMVKYPPDLMYSRALDQKHCDNASPSTSSKAVAKPKKRKSGLHHCGSGITTSELLPSVEPDERSVEISKLADITLTRAIFLVQALMKEPKTHRVAYELALFILELPRGPAATMYHEVKLYYLETELVALLRRLEIGPFELQLVRDRAKKYIELSTAYAASPRPCVLPIAFAHYILDALSYSHNLPAVTQGRRSSSGISTRADVIRRSSDEMFAVRVALEALGMKLVVSEAEYPMLCESTRRQRGELALTMLLRYRDCTKTLALVLDNLLDPAMHRLYKDHVSNAAYYLEQDPIYQSHPGQRPQYPMYGQSSDHTRVPTNSATATSRALRDLKRHGSLDGVDPVSLSFSEHQISTAVKNVSDDDAEMAHLSERFDMIARDSADESSSLASAGAHQSSDEGNDSPSGESSISGISHGAMLENMRDSPRSVSSGSPENNISSPVLPLDMMVTESGSSSSPHVMDCGVNYYRHSRRKPIPNSPNQASEAQAHYMMELAKRLLVEAGGNQSTVIFQASQSVVGQNNMQHNGPHRQLHICSFLIGLYALGLNNLVSTSWQTRTYSTNVSWIHGQAIEIGTAAIKIVERVWEAHLTPTEIAALADKASQSRDPGMVEAAANLALSVLPKAYALTAAESQKALHQCKEQCSEMLEKACKAVEQAAEKDGVYPEVLFKVARHWYDLFVESETQARRSPVSINYSVSQSLSTNSMIVTRTVYQSPNEVSSIAQALPNGSVVHLPVPYLHTVSHPSQMIYQTPVYLTRQPVVSARPAMFVPSVNSPQQPVMMLPYAPRCTAMPPTAPPISVAPSPAYMTAAGVPPPAALSSVAASSARSLHMSHSAPNLSPMQAVQMSRRTAVPPPPPPYGISGVLVNHAQTSAAVDANHLSQIQLSLNSHHHHHLQHQQQQPQQQSQSPLQQQHQLEVTSAKSTHPPQQPAISSIQSSLRFQSSSAMNVVQPQLQPPPSMVPPFQLPTPSHISSTSGIIGGDTSIVKLVHAHRVGMKAMETMGHRNLDDNRSYAKFSQNPTYADDVRWLFTVSMRLGGIFVQSFCEVAARSVASPFVLFSLAVESAKVFQWQVPSVTSYHTPSFVHPTMRPQTSGAVSRLNYAPQVRAVMIQNGFFAPTADLMQHCVEMFYMAASSKLSHPRFVQSDTEEVVQLVRTAREAFYWIPGAAGKVMFDDFMRHVRKQKACKKDVAQRINSCLQQPS
ncbi:hypothetical protein AB6A40_000579 [Gnathostoma spinigerum]|uniref:SWIM-type domain-containing protein n=1 Tax=Gnathostoma spinigerum TaxID=75299 RepID=A0ABD6E3B7_9BILA